MPYGTWLSGASADAGISDCPECPFVYPKPLLIKARKEGEVGELGMAVLPEETSAVSKDYYSISPLRITGAVV